MRKLLCFAALAAAVAASSVLTGCQDPIVRVRDELHPAGGRFLVTATLETWTGGYYSAVVTIYNTTAQSLDLAPSMFRLEGTSPSAFVPADHVPVLLGQTGFQMPGRVGPRGTAQGEVFFSIRGTDKPYGPIRLVVTLPDGAHTFDFDLID